MGLKCKFKFKIQIHSIHNDNAFAIINRTTPCATIINDVSANSQTIMTSSKSKRVKLVAQPPQHITPCVTQTQIASSRKPVPLPRFQSKVCFSRFKAGSADFSKVGSDYFQK